MSGDAGAPARPRRPLPAQVPFAVAAVAAFATILVLGRGLTFYSDEWAFITDRSIGNVGDWLRPHQEHLSALLVVGYRVLVDVVGLHSYLPYLFILGVLHIVVAAGVFRLAAANSGPIVGLGLSVVVLFLGSGFENLFWAFQIGFVGATAAGVWALVALTERDDGLGAIVAAILLSVSIATVGVGLFFLGAAAVMLVLDPRRRRHLVALAVPGGLYVAWYLTIGREAVSRVHDPFTLSAIAEVPGFVVAGLGEAIGSISGFGFLPPAVLVALGAIASVAIALRRRRVPALAVGAFAGVLVEYGLIALVRAESGSFFAAYSRYTYEAVVLLAIGGSALVGRPPLPSAVAWRRLVVAGSSVLLTVSLAWNIGLEIDGAELFDVRADYTRALIDVAQKYGDAPGIDRNTIMVPVVSVAAVREATATYGDARQDDWFRGLTPPISAEAEDRALLELVHRNVIVATASSSSASPPCRPATQVPPGSVVDVVLPNGTLFLAADRVASVDVILNRSPQLAPGSRMTVPLQAAHATSFHVPLAELGWHLQILGPARATTSYCIP